MTEITKQSTHSLFVEQRIGAQATALAQDTAASQAQPMGHTRRSQATAPTSKPTEALAMAMAPVAMSRAAASRRLLAAAVEARASEVADQSTTTTVSLANHLLSGRTSIRLKKLAT